MEDKIENILSFSDLKIGYYSGKTGNILLPPLNASARHGELIAVIGKNGIGKSTLLRTLAGLQKPIGGDILYYNKNLHDHSRMELARKVGYISTEIVKVSNMRVYDLVALGRFPHTNWIGKIEPGDNDAIINALAMTSMQSFTGKFISELSDGERQKTMIARILAQDTGIMIMDEPTAFLDVAGKYEIFHLMNMLSAEKDKTIIFSTHDLQLAINQADKIWLILDSELIEGAPEDLVIAGAFDHLFNSRAVLFNSEDGTYSYQNELKGRIFIEGSGKARHWTEKAINRAGFTITNERTNPFIILPSAENQSWCLWSDTSVTNFGSVYDLIACLKKEAVNLS